MDIFQSAESTTAFLKMGIMGKQGAGKSYTAAKVAVGLVHLLKEKKIDYASKPVAFFDTETGSDWLIPMFKSANIPMVVAKKKSFADLLAATRWAEQNASLFIIDSITHPWRELLESYMKTKQRSFLQIDDWGYLKGSHGWQQFTDLYVNTKLHIIMCGRAGDDTEQYTDENGKRQFEKVGVKMKTETETGFEPSLLVLMEREFNSHLNKVTHRGIIMKDRSAMLDDKEFDDPTFQDFLPHIALLNLGGGHIGVDTAGNSQHILTMEKRDWQPVQKKIVLDEIETLLTLRYPSTGKEDKVAKLKLILKHFNATWTEIETTMQLIDLRAGYDSLYQELEGKPSKYAAALRGEPKGDFTVITEPQHSTAAQTTLALNDDLPDFVKAPLPPGVHLVQDNTKGLGE